MSRENVIETIVEARLPDVGGARGERGSCVPTVKRNQPAAGEAPWVASLSPSGPPDVVINVTAANARITEPDGQSQGRRL